MNNEEIYVLTMVYQCDDGNCGHHVMGVYRTIEEARKRFQKEMENARIDFENLDTVEEDYQEGDMTWSIWERENYCFNHIDLSITQCKVQ